MKHLEDCSWSAQGEPHRRAFHALHVRGRRSFWQHQDRKRAVHFVAFLQRIAATYPSGPLSLAMDNVRMHDATVVRALLVANRARHRLAGSIEALAAGSSLILPRIPSPCL